MVPKMLEQALMIQEAYHVLHGLPVNRMYTDEQIMPIKAELMKAEIDLAWAEEERHDARMRAHYDEQNEWYKMCEKNREP